MKVTVKLFASFREAVGTPQQSIEVTPGSTAAQVWERLVEAHPRLAPFSRSAAFAVNGRYAQPNTPLNDGDTLAFLPPVSGG